MRFALGVLALMVLTAIPAKAFTTIDDPAAFVRGVYAHWDSGKAPPEDIYSDRLGALIALDNREAHGEVGRGNDFSFWCDCQDGTLKHPAVKSRTVENAEGRKVVTAKFDLDGRKKEIEFYFENSKKGWKLDDVRLLGKNGWTLSLILKYGWAQGSSAY